MSTIEEKAQFDFIRYGSVWEDADVLCEALEPAANGGTLLSIASSGDNALSLLTLNPKEVIAIDFNPTQIACIEIRKAAFQKLSYDDLVKFLGVVPCNSRKSTYQKLRDQISSASQQFWDMNGEAIDKGIIHSGKFERYLHLFGLKILPWIHSKQKIECSIKNKNLNEQMNFYNSEWDTWLWRMLFNIFFSKLVMGKRGRDPAFFDHVQGSIAKHILKRTKHAFTEIPTHTNPYLTYIITGNYRPHALPRYLRKENYQTIKDNIEKLTIIKGGAQEIKDKAFDGYNLSDIFEYMTIEEAKDCYSSLIESAKPGARLVYWNMQVQRSLPKCLKDKVSNLQDLSQSLHHRDKAWFYSKLYIDEVNKKGG